MIVKPFKSKLKIKYDSALGMYVITGESLTRTTDGLTFYDKTSAISFKNDLDTQDFHFYHAKNLK